MVKVPDIHLTANEQCLLEKIFFDWTDHDQLRLSLGPMAALSESLLERGAISEVRLRYFTDPDCNPGGRGKSRQNIFERNGTCGDEIMAHPHFLKYLQYFVFGPNLPATVKHQFREIAKFSGHLTTSDLIELSSSAKAVVRSEQLIPAQAAEEFYKLALEHGALPSSAELIRNSIRQVRR